VELAVAIEKRHELQEWEWPLLTAEEELCKAGLMEAVAALRH